MHRGKVDIRDPRDAKLDTLNKQPFFEREPRPMAPAGCITDEELVAIAHSAYVREANMDHQERLRLVVRAIRKALGRP